eukprot:CAMPEP_0116879866 /NCGR_PEP_ID=MMETSP0463-20121206/11715_1 /TAXON_ID=181622 /ORGANISM="Strombidinopsis sp, Strain SopsisLIS2011" /LENGTH=94 /DNA_ID=CAMNT_0004529713 /DNA_START=930 /DNA_END=1214 /DNA_ORIENTATION=-
MKDALFEDNDSEEDYSDEEESKEMPGVFTKIINGEKIMFNKGIKFIIEKEKAMLKLIEEKKLKVIDLDNIPDGEEDKKELKAISEYTFNRTEYS